MPSSNDNQARLHRAYAELLDLDEESTGQNDSNASLLTLVGGLDLLLEPYRLANPPAELSRSIDLLARELATNDPQPAPRHFWQIGPFGNRGDGGGSGRPTLPSDDHDPEPPEPPRRWSLGRELAGIAAVIVILALVGGALVAVFRGQNGSTSSPAASASPTAAHYPPLPSYSRFNPGAQQVYSEGLGKHVNITSTNDGFTWTLHWVYADAVQTLVYYSITPPANTNYKILANDVKMTSADGYGYPRSAYGSGGNQGDAGVTIGPDGQADFFASVFNVEPVTDKVTSIALTLTFSDVADVVSAEESHKIAGGTTLHVTVPLDSGHTIAVNQQGKLLGTNVNLDRIVVAPSGVMVFLSYPSFPSASPASPPAVTAIQPTFDIRLFDGGSEPIKAPGFFSVPDAAIWFLHSPPEKLTGNWSLVLQPYGSDKQPITDQSQWLTFTFLASPGASVATILPAQPLPNAIKTDGNSIGDPNAPVKVVEYGDYQCSACHYFFQNGRTKLLNDYVATGKVYFTFRDFPFFGPQSENAAAAAWCANDQGKYWEFHDTMYGNQPPEGKNGITDALLGSVANSIGLNMQQFNQCYDSGKYKSKVRDELASAKKLQEVGTLNGAPTFFVNGSPVASADYSRLKSTIETVLQQCFAAPGTSCVPPEFIGSPPAQINAATTPNATPTASPDALKNVPDVIGARGVQEAYAAGFGVTPSTVEAVATAKIAVKWAYADSRVAFVSFDITGLPSPAPPTPSSANIGSCMTNGTVSTNAKSGIASPANRLGGYSGGWQGDVLHCSASWFAAYGHELGPDITSITMHINGKLGDADATPYTLTQKMPVIQARVVEPHLQGEVNGQPVTLDRVVVTPSATMFFLHGPGVGKPVPGATTPVPQPDRFLINGAGSSSELPKDSETFVGGLTSPGSSEYVYAGYYAEPTKPGPWTVKIMATDATGKVVSDPRKTATFTFNLPAAGWVPAAAATPGP